MCGLDTLSLKPVIHNLLYILYNLGEKRALSEDADNDLAGPLLSLWHEDAAQSQSR